MTCSRKSTLSPIIGAIIGTGLVLSFFFTLAFAFAGLTARILDQPVVRYSAATGSCIRVIPPAAGSCANLPNSYTIEYIP